MADIISFPKQDTKEVEPVPLFTVYLSKPFEELVHFDSEGNLKIFNIEKCKQLCELYDPSIQNGTHIVFTKVFIEFLNKLADSFDDPFTKQRILSFNLKGEKNEN